MLSRTKARLAEHGYLPVAPARGGQPPADEAVCQIEQQTADTSVPLQSGRLGLGGTWRWFCLYERLLVWHTGPGQEQLGAWICLFSH